MARNWEKIKEILDKDCREKKGHDNDGFTACDKFRKCPTRCYACQENDDLSKEIAEVE